MAQSMRLFTRSMPLVLNCGASLRQPLSACHHQTSRCGSQKPRPITQQKRSERVLLVAPGDLYKQHTSGRRLTTSAVANASSDLAQMIEQKNSENPVVIYSKSYCPFSNQVKSFFKESGVDFKAFELDQIEEGEDILDLLVDKSGSRTVPQIFVKGQYIGGCDDTMKKRSNGQLQQIFDKAGLKVSL